MIELVVFDLDGTLLDTVEDLAGSVNHALALHGFPTHPTEKFYFFVGNGVRELIRRALPEDRRDDATVEALRADFVEHYTKHYTDKTKPYPGIPELIAGLSVQNTAMAVASNKYQSATETLAGIYFPPGTFRVVLGQREGIPPKPDPGIVFEILHRCGVSKNETLYIGDSGTDMQTARAAGVCSVGVTWGFRPREELIEQGAVHLADHPSDILGIIESLDR